MTSFYRLSGGGNDFLALAEPTIQPTTEEISAWCRRGVSAGADGLFVLQRTDSGITMRHFNADGSSANFCLNGTRCAVQLAKHLEWVDDEIEVLTGAGPVRGRTQGSSTVSLALTAPTKPRLLDLKTSEGNHSAWFVDVGVPHLVLLHSENLQSVPIDTLGPLLRSHPDLGEEGANIDFVRFIDRARFEIRTFERGVEAETLACGSGVLAAAAVGLTLDEIDLPIRALTLGGFELTIATDSDASEDRWIFTGDARLVARGTLFGGALDLPPEVHWTL